MSYCLELARRGDRRAATGVVDSLRPRLEKMAAYYARRCGEDADDLLQEAWVGLLEALPGVDLRIGRPEQYLIKRAKWRLLDAVKRARVRRCSALDEQTVDGRWVRMPEIALEGADLAQFRRRLKPTQQAVLECLLAGLTWREAGRALGCTSANVAYHVRQIRREYESWSVAPSVLLPRRPGTGD